ncbi:MAG: L-threonylcarbamoyladenylate synthase [Flavobacteriales bacterium]
MLIALREHNIDERKLQQVVQCMLGGGVIIYPTDTVYSLGCDMLNKKAVERIARLKNIRTDKANFSLVCSDLSHLADYCKQVSNPTFKLMKQLLPGPYTFILDAGKNIPNIFSERKKTIGIRVPDNAIAQQLVQQMGRPIIATSVHDEDEVLEYTTDPQLIYERWQHEVDMVIDGGILGLEPSTVIDCTGAQPLLVRQGKGKIAT